MPDSKDPPRHAVIGERASEAPAGPGVYLMLGAASEVLYVGKAVDLRRRLRDHGRSGHARWSGVRDVRWIACEEEAEALCLEADLIFAAHPPFNAVVTLDDFLYLCVERDATSVRFALARQPRARAYGGFPHLGKGKMSWPAVRQKAGYAALLRLLWAACAGGREMPARLRGDSPPVDHPAPMRPDLEQPLHALLSGRSPGLLGALEPAVEQAPTVMRRGLEQDVDAAKGFYRVGPRALRALRLRHGERPPVDEVIFERMVVDDLRAAVGHVAVVPRVPATDVARGRTARSLEQRALRDGGALSGH